MLRTECDKFLINRINSPITEQSDYGAAPRTVTPHLYDPDVADERYDIAYREALRAIADQQVGLDVVQNRASTVVSAGALVTGLLGFGVDRDSIGIAGLVATALFLCVVLLTGAIIWPRRKWRFHFKASELHWNYIEGAKSLSPDLMKRDLALYLEKYFEKNSKTVDRFGFFLSGSVIVLFLEVSAVVLENLEAMTMDRSTPEVEPEEKIEPGKPLRPDPGAPETRGGSMDRKQAALEDQNRPR